MNFTIRTTKKNLKNVSLAPSVIVNNKRNIFSNIKDKRNSNYIKDFSEKVYTNQNDVGRTVSCLLNNVNSKIRQHCDYCNHSMDVNIESKNIVQYSNKRDLNIAKDVL